MSILPPGTRPDGTLPSRRRHARCPMCARELEPIVHVGWLPAHVGVLWRSKEAAQHCPRGRVDLGSCISCGFVGNPSFDPALLDYEQEYDNALHHSNQFRSFEQSLAYELLDTHQVRGGTYVEVGCGDGHFLGLLAALGDGRGYGYDPSHRAEAVDADARERVSISPQPFGAGTAPPPFDLACIRQVIEHLDEPMPLLTTLGRAARQETGVVYADVPHGARMLREGAVWELMYEHFGYYTPSSLQRLFESAGYAPTAVRTRFDGQFLGIEARYTGERKLNGAGTNEQRRLRRLLEGFAADLDASVERAAGVLAYLRRRDRRPVVWGAGARTTTYLNLTDGTEDIEAVVDINPNKRGTFVAGTGHPIVEPAALRELEPDVVILTNPVYAEEVGAQLDRLGLSGDLVTTSGDVLRLARS